MKRTTLRAACALTLAMSPCASFASVDKAGPRDTIAIDRAAPQAIGSRFAALSIDPADLARASRTEKSAACAQDRIGPRNTIRRCR